MKTLVVFPVPAETTLVRAGVVSAALAQTLQSSRPTSKTTYTLNTDSNRHFISGRERKQPGARDKNFACAKAPGMSARRCSAELWRDTSRTPLYEIFTRGVARLGKVFRHRGNQHTFKETFVKL